MSREEFVELCEQLVAIMRTGTREEAKRFLLIHSQDFPENLDGKTMRTFFKEVLSKFENEADFESAMNLLAAAVAALKNNR
jgi:hypothetical protein